MYSKNRERDQLIISGLTELYPDHFVKAETLADMLCITLKAEKVFDALKTLYENKDFDFNFLTTLCGMHYPDENQLGVVYHFHSFRNNHRIRIKTSFPIQQPAIKSVTPIWPAANWMEREAFDFFGIEFEGHPNLKRILNMDEMEGFPLRKEFPLEDQTREDKDNTMFGR